MRSQTVTTKTKLMKITCKKILVKNEQQRFSHGIEVHDREKHNGMHDDIYRKTY